MSQETEQPPPEPREITHYVRGRAWSEPRVRFWWLAAAVIGSIGIAFVLIGLYSRSHQAWLIEKGKPVEATIYEANGENLKGRNEPPESVVVLKFQWEGKEFTAQPRVLGRRDKVPATLSVNIH